jgi:CheY-like chemotaxis protein
MSIETPCKSTTQFDQETQMKTKVIKLRPISEPLTKERDTVSLNQKDLNGPTAVAINSSSKARRSRLLAGPLQRVGRSLPELRAIMLISDDSGLHQELRRSANEQRRIVVRVSGIDGIEHVIQLLRPTVVLLDLDLSQDVAWNVGETLLRQQDCPPVILLTARAEPFELRMAISSGSVLDKSKGPAHLLEAMELALDRSRVAQEERKTAQRMLLRWLRPLSWPLRSAINYRFWGINE